MQRSAQVVDALLTLAAQLHVAPQEGETLRGGEGRGAVKRRRNQGGDGAKLNGCAAAAAAYLQDQRVAPGHVLLRGHVEEGEAHAQAVQRVVGVSLEGLGVLTCKRQSHSGSHQSQYSSHSLFSTKSNNKVQLQKV